VFWWPLIGTVAASWVYGDAVTVLRNGFGGSEARLLLTIAAVVIMWVAIGTAPAVSDAVAAVVPGWLSMLVPLAVLAICICAVPVGVAFAIVILTPISILGLPVNPDYFAFAVIAVIAAVMLTFSAWAAGRPDSIVAQFVSGLRDTTPGRTDALRVRHTLQDYALALSSAAIGLMLSAFDVAEFAPVVVCTVLLPLIVTNAIANRRERLIAHAAAADGTHPASRNMGWETAQRLRAGLQRDPLISDGRILRRWTMLAWLLAGISFMGVFERGPGAPPLRGDLGDTIVFVTLALWLGALRSTFARRESRTRARPLRRLAAAARAALPRRPGRRSVAAPHN
jgi:hypothetical protein